MDKWILKALLLFFFLCASNLVVSGRRFCSNPTPPVCADDCSGNRYYLNEDETECIQCPTCPAGQELNKACGNGMNGDAVCTPCQEGFFSSSTSRYCTPCTMCVNSVELEPCQVTQDRVCGDCLPGFVRSSNRFSTDLNACPERCSDLPRDAPQCRDWWSEQEGEPLGTEQPLEPAPVDQPVRVEPLDDPDACEPKPPKCIDRCGDGNFYLDYDGLCKACLQCQPGEELDKVCGRGKNGDANCQPCPEGHFSEYGIGPCTPCRICVNTEATECTATGDSVCGECLLGYYQDADGFFPDKEACPNKCLECPTTIPQCQEWCESKDPVTEVTVNATQSAGQDPVSLQALTDFPNGLEKEQIIDEAGHASYTTIFIVLTSLLTVIVVVLVIVLVVFRHFWKRTDGSNASFTAESRLLPGPSETTSPRSSPGSSPTTVYSPTTYPVPLSENSWELLHYLNTFIPNMNGERPVSGSSTDGENRSSTVSTPTMILNRRLADRDLRRQALDRHPSDSSTPSPQHQSPNPWSILINSPGSMNLARSLPVRESSPMLSVAPKSFDQEPRPNERLGYTEEKSSPRAPSSGKVFTQKESGTVHQHVEDQDEAPGRLVRRRSSILNIGNNSEQVLSLKDPSPQGKFGERRYSLPCLPLVSDDIKMLRKVSNDNTSPVREPEAALFPPDSSSDDGRTTDALADTNNKTTDSKHQGRRSGPTTSSRTTATDGVGTKQKGPKRPSLDVLPEKSRTETTPEKKSAQVDLENSGNIGTTGSRSPGEHSVTININMTAKDIDTVHVGDVHSKHTYARQTFMTSEQHDEDNDGDESERLLNMTTSKNETIPEPHNHTCSDEDDDEEDKLLDPKSS